MDKIKVLFVCVHNSARSQMAEAFLNKMAGDRFEAYSAGLEPGTINPIVVEVMEEAGIDISGNKAKSVFDLYKNNTFFSYVITVCDQASGEHCPIFPGAVKQLHMGFDDPSTFQGTKEEQLAKTRVVRDQIEAKIKQWVNSI